MGALASSDEAGNTGTVARVSTARTTARPLQVLVLRPTLGQGGADRVTALLLRQFSRDRINATLALARQEGPHLDLLPRDVEVVSLGERRLVLTVPNLTRLLRRRSFDVVLSTSGGMNTIASLSHFLARSRAGLVLSERNKVQRGTDLKARFELGLKKLLYRRADIVTAVSLGVARDLIDVTDIDESVIRYMPNPVVDRRLEEQSVEALEHPWFSDGLGTAPFVTAGRLVPQKDHHTLLTAVAMVRQSHPDFRLVVLGDGPLRSELEAQRDMLGLHESVDFVGFDPNPFRYMARASGFVLSSRHEGMPGVLIQAMALELPVVSTDCDFGPAELLEDGQAGLLVPVGDAKAMAAAITALIDDSEGAMALAAAARIRVQEFEVALATAGYEQVLIEASEREGMPV